MQVMLRDRSDSNPAQDEVVDKHNDSFTVELSRPPPPPTGSTLASDFPPDDEMEDHQCEFPEGM